AAVAGGRWSGAAARRADLHARPAAPVERTGCGAPLRRPGRQRADHPPRPEPRRPLLRPVAAARQRRCPGQRYSRAGIAARAAEPFGPGAGRQQLPVPAGVAPIAGAAPLPRTGQFYSAWGRGCCCARELRPYQSSSTSTAPTIGSISQLMVFQPELVSRPPEPKEASATVPNTRKSFIDWVRERSAGV